MLPADCVQAPHSQLLMQNSRGAVLSGRKRFKDTLFFSENGGMWMLSINHDRLIRAALACSSGLIHQLCFQVPVRQGCCRATTAAATLRLRAATSRTTAATAPMRRTAGLPVPSRTATAAGRAPGLITMTGRWESGLREAPGLHTTTR